MYNQTGSWPVPQQRAPSEEGSAAPMHLDAKADLIAWEGAPVQHIK